MIRKYLDITIMLGCLIFMVGCNEDILITKGDRYSGNGELIVSIDCVFPEQCGTRSAVPNAKTAFVDKDVIQVGAIFTFADGTTENGYGSFIYDGPTNSWIAQVPQLTWPNTAVSGVFEAYYMPGATGTFTPGGAATSVLLKDLTNVDPLYASKTESMDYGKAVRLDFHHLLTYLTLTEMPLFSNYWFSASPKVSEGGSAMSFYNQANLSLSEDKTLKIEYSAVATEPNYTDGNGSSLIFIDGKYNNAAQEVSFFLVPGFYDEFELLYPAANYTTYTYLTYQYKGVGDDTGDGNAQLSTAPMLEAGYTYTLNAMYSQGVEIIKPSDQVNEPWDESEDYYDIDVEDFLRAARNGESYYVEGTEILKQVNNGVQLQHNVNFNFAKYTVFDDFSPDILGSQVFDGNYHYIKQLGSPLFNINHGEIKNLGLKIIKVDVISVEVDTKGNDLSHVGGICRHNSVTGLINNVRMVEGGTINGKVKILNSGDEGQETHNFGLAVGWNEGKVLNINLSGNFNLEVAGFDASVYNATVVIGGIIGQSTGGIISDISTIKASGYEEILTSINVTNRCIGEQAAYNVGGIIGFINGSNTVSDIILGGINVDSSPSKGMVSYVGGLAGLMETTDIATVNSTTIAGTVQSGIVEKDPTVSGELSMSLAYTGGITGSDRNVIVTNSSFSFNVKGPQRASEYVGYATGGGFGNITFAVNINNIIIASAGISRPADVDNQKWNYAGSFAGILQYGQSWANDYSTKNNYVSPVNGMDYVGYSFPDRANMKGKVRNKRVK